MLPGAGVDRDGAADVRETKELCQHRQHLRRTVCDCKDSMLNKAQRTRHVSTHLITCATNDFVMHLKCATCLEEGGSAVPRIA